MKTKKLFALLMAGMLSTGLVACGGGGDDDTGSLDPSTKVTITFYGWGDTEEQNNYTQLINQFMAANPNITVAYTCDSSTVYMTTLMQSANNLPDMFYMPDEDFMQWVSSGVLKDISSYVTEQELSTIWEHAVDEYYFNMDDYTLGKSEGAGLYGLPKDLGPFTLVYNKGLVASKISQYNLDTEIYQGTTTWAQHINSKLSATVPMTWQEFRAILKKIDQDPNDNFYGITHYELDSAIYSNNASYFDDTASTSKIAEKNFTDALQFVADLHLVDGVMPSAANQTSTNGYQRLLNGTAAFSFMGPWDNAAFWKSFPGEYDILPVPYNGENPNAKSVTWVGSMGYCISEKANNAKTQACIKLAKYLCMDEEAQRDFYALGQQVPNIVDMAMGEYLTDSEGRLANNSVIIDGVATPMNTASKPVSRSVWVDTIDGDDSDNISGKTRPCYYTYQSDWESVFLTYINDQGLWTGARTAAEICSAYNATFQDKLDTMRADAGF